PHRAAWRIGHAGRPGGEPLSRGQAKLTALACLLAQAEDFAAQRGHWPVFLLDDLTAELDRGHQERLLARLRASGAQVFVSGTEHPRSLEGAGWMPALLHVEQGRVEPRPAPPAEGEAGDVSAASVIVRRRKRPRRHQWLARPVVRSLDKTGRRAISRAPAARVPIPAFYPRGRVAPASGGRSMRQPRLHSGSAPPLHTGFPDASLTVDTAPPAHRSAGAAHAL